MQRNTTRTNYTLAIWLADPHARVAEHPHPRAVFAPLWRMPRHLHGAEHALGVRHDHGDATIGRRHRCDTVRRAVRVRRIDLGDVAVAVDEPRADQLLCLERFELR